MRRTAAPTTGTTMATSMATTMTTGTTITATITDGALLQLIWLASPALPVGGFSYSEGLEAAIDSGRVTDESSAAGWLADQLHLTLARADLAVLAQAVPAWRAGDSARIAQLNDWVLATREKEGEGSRFDRLRWERELVDIGAEISSLQAQAAHAKTRV